MEFRNYLARVRTTLANQRTFLAFLRTSLILFATSATLLKVFSDDILLFITGWIFLPLSVLVFVIGLLIFLSTNKKIKEYDLSTSGKSFDTTQKVKS